MSVWEEYVLPHLVSIFLGTKRFARERKQAVAGARGRVLEIGFGSGPNLPLYPGTVEAVVGVDPSAEAAKIAKKRIAEAPFPVEHLALSGEQLPVDAGSFDSAVSTMTLCTIPDAVAALREVSRALKVGGELFFLEHGLSPDPGVQKWQNRWDPYQAFLFGGCHVNRKIDALVREAGLEITTLDTYYTPGPKIFGFMYRGVAKRVR